MSNDSDAAVGRLAMMDGALNNLLCDLAVEITGQDTKNLTSGRAAQNLLGHAKQDAALITPDVTDWLKRVVLAAEERNTVMHSVAQDQCVICGNATEFAHKGKPVNRTVSAVTAVSEKFRDLIDEGSGHARGISQVLNERAVAAAVKAAAVTGQVQSPRQVLIGQSFHRCVDCSPGGNPITVVSAPAAAAALPPP